MSTRYTFDSRQSRFTIHAVATGVLSFAAHSPTFAVRELRGEAGMSGQVIDKLALVLSARSLELQDRVAPADRREIEGRMQEEVLETSRFPEVHFHAEHVPISHRARGEYQARLDGQLDLHGVSRPERVPADVLVYDDALRLRGRHTLRMSEYRIKPVTALGGMIKLRDELEISFDIVGFPEQP